MVDFSKQFATVALAAGTALTTGCATGPVVQGRVTNTTYQAAAVSNQPVAVTRCEDNGISVVDATPMNMAGKGWQGGYGYNGYHFGRYYDAGNQRTEEVLTASGSKLITYSYDPNNNIQAGNVAGAIAGGAAMSGVGKGSGNTAAKGLGVVLGAAILGPMVDRGVDAVTKSFRRATLVEIAACKQDLQAQFGNPYSNLQQQQPYQQQYPGSRQGADSPYCYHRATWNPNYCPNTPVPIR